MIRLFQDHREKSSRLLASLLLAFSFGTPVLAQQDQQLVVWLTNGEKIVCSLAERPRTTFSSDSLFVETTTTTIAYPLRQVVRSTYELGTSGVDIVKSARPVYIERQGNELLLKNLPDATRVQLYATDGRLLATFTATAGQPVRVSLEQYPVGAYIVKAGQSTCKLLKQ